MKKIYFSMKALCLILIVGTPFSGSAQLVSLGTGTVSNGTTVAGPINEFSRSMHCQMVYTKAEINAAGAIGGFMTQFGFYVTGGVTNPLPNFTIKMKHTTAINTATYDGTSLLTVYNSVSYNPVAGGWDLLTLNTPFTWNGFDNILVDVCFDQTTASSSTGQLRLYTPTVTNGLIYVRSNTAPQCGVNCSVASVNKPQAQMNFVPAPLDLGVNAFLKPLSSKPCYGNDTIRTRIINYGSTAIDFATTPASITVISSGLVNASYTVSLTTGTLNPGAALDTIVTTSYNMSQMGTYILKAFTTYPGDGIPLNDTLKKNFVKKPFFITTYTPNDTICREVKVQLKATVIPAQVGTDVLLNTATQYPAPYGNYYEGAKHQFLVLASELSAAGVNPGNIQTISFNVQNLNSTNSLQNFNIAMMTTTMTSISSIVPGPTPVFSVSSYTPSLGLNIHTLSTPFNWNGTDNILVQTCFNNTSNGATSNVSFYQSNMAFTASAYYYQSGSTSVCTYTGAGSGSNTRRPNIYFGQSTPVTYNWVPATGLSSGSIFNPIASPAASTVYTITVNKTALGCTSYDTLRLVIKETPHVYLGHDTTLCTPSFILNAGNDATAGYTWSSSAATTNTIAVTTTGYYRATGTSTTGCTDKDTIHVTFTTPPIVTLGPDTNFCQGSSITLNAGNAGNLFSWTKQGGGFSASSQAVTISTAGTYYVSVTSPLSLSCVNTDTIVINQATVPSVGLTLPNPNILCHFDNPISLNGGLPSGGYYIGAGVVSNTTFNPALVGPGTYLILYNYTAANGCAGQASDTMRVKTCTGIDELDGMVSLRVYPNPNEGVCTISIHSIGNLNASLNVLTIDGRLVHTEQVKINGGLYEKQFDMSGLTNGVYFLRLESEDTIRNFKLLKQ